MAHIRHECSRMDGIALVCSEDQRQACDKSEKEADRPHCDFEADERHLRKPYEGTLGRTR